MAGCVIAHAFRGFGTNVGNDLTSQNNCRNSEVKYEDDT